jgi:hypothetical protein
METILQRMVWNTRGWQMPSGATNEKGFPSDTGFGHEEWNLQREDAFREHVYPSHSRHFAWTHAIRFSSS